MARGSFLLLGSGEFEPWSAEPERDVLGGRTGDGPVLILPTASAPEGDDVFDRWASMGLEHYASIGVPARVVPLKVRADAERPDLVEELRDASLVFFSGGSPRYLADTLAGTPFWTAVLAALGRGAVYAGCSAGAMVAGRRPSHRPGIGSRWMAGLDLVPHVRFGAHWNRMRYLPGFRGASGATDTGWFVGIDERTAILGDGQRWRVYGVGAVEVRADGEKRSFRAGESFATPA
ncbi:MAG: Type 1 glutamine amidotransferase-like domain-containing protein [Actinomycetota bacterium]